MFILSNEDRGFLSKHVDNAEKLIEEQNAEELFIEIEYAILREGFDKDGFYNAFGHRLQQIHDNLIDSIEENEKNT